MTQAPKFEVEYDGSKSLITLNGEKVTTWNDDANQDYPEDLTWDRDISGLVIASIEAGYNLGQKKKVEMLEAKLDFWKNQAFNLVSNKEYQLMLDKELEEEWK